MNYVLITGSQWYPPFCLCVPCRLKRRTIYGGKAENIGKRRGEEKRLCPCGRAFHFQGLLFLWLARPGSWNGIEVVVLVTAFISSLHFRACLGPVTRITRSCVWLNLTKTDWTKMRLVILIERTWQFTYMFKYRCILYCTNTIKKIAITRNLWTSKAWFRFKAIFSLLYGISFWFFSSSPYLLPLGGAGHIDYRGKNHFLERGVISHCFCDTFRSRIIVDSIFAPFSCHEKNGAIWMSCGGKWGLSFMAPWHVVVLYMYKYTRACCEQACHVFMKTAVLYCSRREREKKSSRNLIDVCVPPPPLSHFPQTALSIFFFFFPPSPPPCYGGFSLPQCNRPY